MESCALGARSNDNRPTVGSAVTLTAFALGQRKARVRTIFIFSIAMVSASTIGCNDSGSSSLPMTGIQGQVYSIATPGPTPIGWVPPPLEKVSTIFALDSNRTFIFQVLTDDKGRFLIELQPGSYYLRVKESMIPAETGPHAVKAGELVSAQAHYDNGMR